MKITAIVPAYNEAARIVNVLQKLSSVKSIDQVIVIDDCSSDKTFTLVNEAFPGVKLIKNSHNLGKSGSIHVGLNHAKNDTILLCDADLKNLVAIEIEVAIQKYFSTNADLIIMRRINQPFLIKLLRADILLSGERILSKKALNQILNKSSGFRLEIIMNDFFFRSKVYWAPSSANNSFKYKKRGLIYGTFANLKMYFDIFIKDFGFIKYNYLAQILFFGKQKIPS